MLDLIENIDASKETVVMGMRAAGWKYDISTDEYVVDVMESQDDDALR